MAFSMPRTTAVTWPAFRAAGSPPLGMESSTLPGGHPRRRDRDRQARALHGADLLPAQLLDARDRAVRLAGHDHGARREHLGGEATCLRRASVAVTRPASTSAGSPAASAPTGPRRGRGRPRASPSAGKRRPRAARGRSRPRAVGEELVLRVVDHGQDAQLAALLHLVEVGRGGGGAAASATSRAGGRPSRVAWQDCEAAAREGQSEAERPMMPR